ncbi:MAG: putative transporter [Bacteroidales bacterium]|nr:putative transporter [Bacteroidales bacterium]
MLDNHNMDPGELLSSVNTASTLIFLALVGIAGILVGRLRAGNLKLGIAGVLFAGLVAGHLGARIDPSVLHFVKEFGLILFVYSIGIEIGPRFISSFRSNGIRLNIMAVVIIGLGFLTSLIIYKAFNLDKEVVAGLLSGAVTNTPSLGAVQSMLAGESGGEGMAETAGMAYAVAYPFGIIGIILVMYLIKGFFRISTQKELEKYREDLDSRSAGTVTVNIVVENPKLFGKKIETLKEVTVTGFVISRISRDGEFIVPAKDTKLYEGDILYGICSKDSIKQLELVVGSLRISENFEITGQLAMRHILITNRKLAGRKLKHINLTGLYPANITRIFRGETEIIPSGDTVLEFGDTARVVGVRDKMNEISKLLGNSLRDLSYPNLVPLFIGIALGVIIGSIPFFIPGLDAPARLGLAGGPLLVALVFGHKGHIGKFDFYMTPGANRFIREMGIVLFLACVGIGSGQHFWETLVNGGYMWMIYAALITFMPLFIVGVVGRMMKINYLTLCGMLSGSMTDPPALEFASSLSPGQAQASAYATVYPLTMFLRILSAQVLLLVLG